MIPETASATTAFAAYCFFLCYYASILGKLESIIIPKTKYREVFF